VLAPTIATPRDVSDLFRDTVQNARSSGGQGTASDLRDTDVDLLDPLAFERWVLRSLDEAGYSSRRTPLKDGGADGLAFWNGAGGEHTLVIQCKHTQTGRNCDHAAVEEVVRSVGRYQSEIRGEAVLVVATNAPGFSRSARILAEEHQVDLVSRDGLPRLIRYSRAE